MSNKLETVGEVVEAIGGKDAVEVITGKRGLVPTWKHRNKFPSNTYLALMTALSAEGKTAPASLWGMTAASSDEER